MPRVSRAHRALCAVLAALIGFTPQAPMFGQSGAEAVVAPISSPSLLAIPQQQPIVVNRSVPAVAAPSDLPRFSDVPTEAELRGARIFAEPLVPVNAAPKDAAPESLARSSDEKRQLASALNAYLQRGSNEQTESIEAFLAAAPDSAWAPSLRINLGIVYRLTGRFTKALEQFEAAWFSLRNDASINGSLLADLALAELAELNARFGRQDRLRALFAESQGRNVRGGARERLVRAKEGLWSMENTPESAFLCGPFAVQAVCQLTNPSLRLPDSVEAKSIARGTSLEQMRRLAQTLGKEMQFARRRAGAPLITPSVVHWKVGHFAALLKQNDGRALVRDGTWRYDHWVESTTVDEEGSGYFLVPAGPLPEGWLPITKGEADEVWGRGDAGGGNPDDLSTDDERMKGPCPDKGLPVYNIHALNISLEITDTPVGYQPPYGPAVAFRLSYLQREANQPQIFNYSHLGRKWTHNWLAYLKDDPGNEADDVYLVAPGGGQQRYSGYDAGTQTYGLQYKNGTKLKRTSTSPIVYERIFPDGSKEVYGQADSQTAFPRRVFLTKRKDAFGNEIVFQYDSFFRLVSVTDAVGQVTTLAYEDPADSLRITKVTDPFGRFAAFEYHPDGLLKKITDVQGISAEFAYRDGDFLTQMTTGYGTTQFDGGEESNRFRWLEVTDPLGQKERAEFINALSSNAHTAVGSSRATTDADWEGAFIHGTSVPDTASCDASVLQYRNSYFWDKKAMIEAPGAYAKAHIYHWVHLNSALGPNNKAANILESEKAPLTGRVWYKYPGQGDSKVFTGITLGSPSMVARTVEDPAAPGGLAAQITQYEYNDFGNVTRITDPKGRITQYNYAGNDQDLLNVKQKANATAFHTVASFTYNANYPHLPVTSKDPSGNTTTYTYNANGQIKTIDNPVDPVVTFNYEPGTGYLLNIDGPISGTSDRVHYTYDSKRNIRTVTQPDGYVLTFDTDNLDRITKVTFPDGSHVETLYELLNPTWSRDRLGRWSRSWFNALGQTIATTDTLNRTTQFDWCACGSLRSLLDPSGRKTMWFRDIAGRPIKKLYDNPASVGQTVERYTYYPYSGLPKQSFDPDNRETLTSYHLDGSLAKIEYPGSTVTPTVSFVYETYWPRLKEMIDGTGTTNYSYKPISTTGTGDGEGLLQTIESPAGGTNRSTVTLTYDGLNRVKTRNINGQVITDTYDELGRLERQVNALGRFDYTYIGATARMDRIDHRTGANATAFKTISTFSYDTLVNDFRLLAVENRNLATTPAMISRFEHTYRPDGFIQTWKQHQTAFGAAKQWTFGYDAADQLVSGVRRDFATQAIEKVFGYDYDRSGNRVMEQQDGVVGTASFNAFNQLTGTTGIGTSANVLVAGKTINPANGQGEVSQVRVNQKPATMFADGSFQAWVPATTGANTFPIEATDGNGNVNSRTFTFTVADGTTRTFTYDLSGNLVNDGERTYTWDAAGCLLTVTKAGVTTEWVYDGQSRRVAEKTNGTVTKRWTYCGLLPCEERNSGGGTVTKRYFAQGFQVGTTDYFTTVDHLGSVREVFDSSGVTRAAYQYDLWGKRSANAITTNPVESDFGFTGHYEHIATGLVLAPYRAYDPVTGRWISRDPIGEAGGMNLYGYALSDPINYVDPLGAKGVPATGVFRSVSRPTLLFNTARGTNAYAWAASIGWGLGRGIGEWNGGMVDRAVENFFYDTIFNDSPKPAPQTASAGQPPGQPPTPPKSAPPCPGGPDGPNGNNEHNARGREAHKWWQPPQGYVKEFTFKNGMRADAVNIPARHILELKPNNPKAIAEGWKQIRKYTKQAQKEFGGTWTGNVVTY